LALSLGAGEQDAARSTLAINAALLALRIIVIMNRPFRNAALRRSAALSRANIT
jgi:hypothetical protein